MFQVSIFHCPVRRRHQLHMQFLADYKYDWRIYITMINIELDNIKNFMSHLFIKDTFDHFAPGGVYADLRDYLSDDILEKYKDSILYISDENSSEKYPCGISLSSDNCTLLQKTNLYDSCILSICHTDSDKKLVKSFCKYILL